MLIYFLIYTEVYRLIIIGFDLTIHKMLAFILFTPINEYTVMKKCIFIFYLNRFFNKNMVCLHRKKFVNPLYTAY